MACISLPFRCEHADRHFYGPTLMAAAIAVALCLNPDWHLAIAQTPSGTSQNHRSSAAEQDTAQLEQRQAAQRAAVQSGDPQAIEDSTRSLSAFALHAMADLRASEHMLPEAVELYHRALALQDSPETRSHLADAELLQKKATFKNGAAQTKAVSPAGRRIDPTSKPTTSQLAHLSPSQAHMFTALDTRLRQILSSSFNDWGTLEARRQRYPEALIYFHEAEDWEASTPGLRRNIGMAAFLDGQYEEAVRALQLAALREPQDQHTCLMLAMSQFSLDRFSDAARTFAMVADLAMRDPRAAYAWALSLARTDRQAKANEIVDKLSTQTLPLDQLALVCKVYYVTANYEQAVKCFRQISQQDPTFKGSHLETGAALIRLDRPTEAIPELQAESKLSPDNLDAQYYLAYAFLQVSRKEEAATLLKSIITADPAYVQAQYQLGRLLLDDGQTEQAIQHLERAANADTTHDYLHYQLHVAYRRAGRTADANRELKLYKEIKASHRTITSPQDHEKN